MQRRAVRRQGAATRAARGPARARRPARRGAARRTLPSVPDPSLSYCWSICGPRAPRQLPCRAGARAAPHPAAPRRAPRCRAPRRRRRRAAPFRSTLHAGRDPEARGSARLARPAARALDCCSAQRLCAAPAPASARAPRRRAASLPPAARRFPLAQHAPRHHEAARRAGSLAATCCSRRSSSLFFCAAASRRFISLALPRPAAATTGGMAPLAQVNHPLARPPAHDRPNTALWSARYSPTLPGLSTAPSSHAAAPPRAAAAVKTPRRSAPCPRARCARDALRRCAGAPERSGCLDLASLHKGRQDSAVSFGPQPGGPFYNTVVNSAAR